MVVDKSPWHSERFGRGSERYALSSPTDSLRMYHGVSMVNSFEGSVKEKTVGAETGTH